MGSPLAGMICHEVESVREGIGMYGRGDAVVIGDASLTLMKI